MDERKSEKASKAAETVKINEIFDILERFKNNRLEYNDSIIHQLLECVRVMSNEKITIVVKGGIEIEVLI